MPTFEFVIAAMRTLSLEERHTYLQRLVGEPTDDPGELDWRAKLVTELRKAGASPWSDNLDV